MKIKKELFDLAVKVFGTREMAQKWFTEPAYGLGGAVPKEAVQTEHGEEEVRNLLRRIEHGVFS